MRLLSCVRRALPAALTLALAAPAAASAAPHVVVWSGALTPHTAAAGVELRADGGGRRLTGDVAGAVHTAGAFTPTASELAAIRRAASALLHGGPSVTHAGGQDGGYVTVLVRDGAASRAVTDTGADSPAVTALLTSVNRALSPGSRLLPAGSRGNAPATAPCPKGQQATEVTKELPLSQASGLGLVGLHAKGPIGGDSMAVDGMWKDIAAPVRIVVHLEIERELDDGNRYAAQVANTLAAEYRGYVVDGQPVNFSFDVVDRARGSAPRPCFHEVLMHAENDLRPYVTDLGPSPQGGEWSAKDPGSWAHETAHLLGLDDEYDDYYHSDEKNIDFILPVRGLEGQELQEFLTPLGLDAKLGHVYSKPHSLYEHDLLGIGGSARLNPFDLGRVTSHATLVITADPGVIVVSKDPIRQNFVTGAHFSLPVPPHGSAHVDGLVAYCIDHDRGQPTGDGPGYDVLGSAGAIGGEAMDALQRVADVVAAREPGPLEETPGARDAIWRVSDDTELSDDSEDDPARAILQAAGVPVTVSDKTFAGPHFSDPDAADPATGALSLTGPVAVPPDPVQGAEPPASGVSRLTRISPSTRRLRLRAQQRVAVLGARVTLTGAPDVVSLRLMRRHGGRTLTVARSLAATLAVGDGSLALAAHTLGPGRYLLVAVAAHGGRLSATITVSRSPGTRHAGR